MDRRHPRSDNSSEWTKTPQNAEDSGWPADYDEYRRQTERRAEEFLTWKSLLLVVFGRSEEPSPQYPEGTPAQVSLGTLVSLLIALVIGIVTWILIVVAMRSSETPLCTTMFAALFFAGLVAYFTLGFLLLIPTILRFLTSPYPWKVIVAFFAALAIPTTILSMTSAYIDKVPFSMIWRTAIGWWKMDAFFAVMMGLSAAALPTRLTIRLFFGFLLVGILIGFTFTALLFVGSFMLYDIPWQVPLHQMLDSGEWIATLILPASFSVFGFWMTWIFWSIWKLKLWPIVRTSWNFRYELLRIPLRRLTEIQQFLSEKLRIHKLYLLVWKLLIIFAILVIVADLRPDQLQILANFNLAFGTIPLAFLLLVTFQYLFIPKELGRVRIETPSYLARPVVQASIVLCLLFLAWWVFHAFFMLNLNVYSTVNGAVGFHFSNGNVARPNIGDFLFYAFALMTNANYTELYPYDLSAKMYTMFVTATGLLLLVVFINAALSYRQEDQ
jgi:MFS family permease